MQIRQIWLAGACQKCYDARKSTWRETVKRLLPTVGFVLFGAIILPIANRAQNLASSGQAAAQASPEHVITVSRSGTVFARPDVGILIMAIETSAPIAEEAVSTNAQKAQSVKSALVTLGYSPDRYKFSSVVLGKVGDQIELPYQPSVTGVEASEYVYLFFGGPQLSDLAQLTGTAAATIEALRKAGATGVNVSGPFREPGQTAMIIYAVKDSQPWENQALQRALERARGAAQTIAQAMQVQITSLRSVTASYLSGRYIPTAGFSQLQLQGLPYSFFSTRSDEVQISANATLSYDFK
jgi:uncharacterized protein YggE